MSLNLDIVVQLKCQDIMQAVDSLLLSMQWYMSSIPDRGFEPHRIISGSVSEVSPEGGIGNMVPHGGTVTSSRSWCG